MKNRFLLKIILLIVIYIVAFTSVLAPFMTIEGANKLLGIVLVIVLSYAFLFILACLIYKHLKTKK